MALISDRLKIYTFQVDEVREAKSEDEIKEWLDLMENQVGRPVSKDTLRGMSLFTTCCSGRPDDCGQMAAI